VNRIWYPQKSGVFSRASKSTSDVIKVPAI
jgi:hypothetical protein